MGELLREIGVIRGRNECLCSQCNADLSAEGSVSFAMHWDGTKEFGYNYTCNKCGNSITQVFARDEESAMWWEDNND